MGRAERRARLRRAIRAGQRLAASAEPFAHHARAGLLETDQRLTAPLQLPGVIPAWLEGRAGECVRRKIIAATMTNGLLRALVDHVAEPALPIALAVPKAWRVALREQGAVIDMRASAIKWRVFVSKRLVVGLKAFVKLARGLGQRASAQSANYAVLCNVSPSVALSATGVAAWDFVDWYRRSSLRPKSAERIWLNGVEQVADPVLVPAVVPLPRLSAWAAIIWFAEGAGMILIATLAAFLGAWRHAVILDELLLLTWAKRVNPSAFAAQYAFQQSDFIVRPLWTYLAERAGSDIVLIFYAINCELFAPMGQADGTHTGYNKLDWPSYAVWDERQAHFIRDCAPRAQISTVGTVGYQDNGIALAADGRRYVAVFDVTPIRPSMLAQMGLPQPYYRTREMQWFLDDIRLVSSKLGFVPVVKAKREDSLQRAPASYRRRLAEWAAARDAAVVDPAAAAERVIDIAEASLSCPFSSTALLGKARGKPSAYYDPTCTLDPDHKLARDIPLLRGRIELEQWFRSILHQHSALHA